MDYTRGKPEPLSLYSSEKKGNQFVFYPQKAEKDNENKAPLYYPLDYSLDQAGSNALVWAAEIHRLIYQKRSDIGAIK